MISDSAFNKRRISLAAIIIICLLLLLPAFFKMFFDYRVRASSSFDPVLRSVISAALFLTPVVFFYRNIKLYLYLLSVWIILSPLFIFGIIAYIRPNFELIAIIFQTNTVEIKEATNGYLGVFLVVTIIYLLVYLLAIKKIQFNRIPFRTGVTISVIAMLVFGLYALKRKYVDYYKPLDILEENYPLGVLSGLRQAYILIKKNDLSKAASFQFHAVKNDSIKERQVFILVIGESSRYDRWGVNGYQKNTTPKLQNRKNLVVFENAVAGCNLTWMSVPQMITRANPDNIDLQFKEKSLLAAFKDVGFKTIWLSNQTDKDIFWSGSITMHAKTADLSIFSPTNTPYLETENYYDERLLSLLDSVILNGNSNIFIVMHTMGNHWVYSSRYPKEFDHFKPSGYDKRVDPFSAANKSEILNAYDNSVLYADYIIDSVISSVEKYHLVSTVMFLSDHGEDLFDRDPDRLDFHLRPSKNTLHIPFFIWTSSEYRKHYEQKANELLEHRSSKIGADNTFYTILNMANISYSGFDSTKSISSHSFIESTQKYYKNESKTSGNFSELNK